MWRCLLAHHVKVSLGSLVSSANENVWRQRTSLKFLLKGKCTVKCFRFPRRLFIFFLKHDQSQLQRKSEGSWYNALKLFNRIMVQLFKDLQQLKSVWRNYMEEIKCKLFSQNTLSARKIISDKINFYEVLIFVTWGKLAKF